MGLTWHKPVLCLMVRWRHGTVLTQPCSLSSSQVRLTRVCSDSALFFVFYSGEVDTGLISVSPVLCFLVRWGHKSVLIQPCSLFSG